MVTIPLTQGKFALVDDDDAEMCSHFGWFINKTRKIKYATAYIPQSGHNGKYVLLHRLISRFRSEYVDHINGNGLDCRKKNMRLATKSQNQRNRRLNENNKTGFKGVSMRLNRKNPFLARIMVDRKPIHLGHFKTSYEAALAYNTASLKYHGEFGRLNAIE